MNEAEIDQALAAAEQTLQAAQSGGMPQQAAPQMDMRVIQQLVDATVRQALAGVHVVQGPPGADGVTPSHEDVHKVVKKVVAATPLPKGDKGDPGERGQRGPRGEIVRTLERITDPRRMAESDGASLVGFLQSGTGALTRTLQDVERAVARSGDFDTDAHFNTYVSTLTETFGVAGLRCVQATEGTGVKVLEVNPVTSGFEPWQIHFNSFANTGLGAGTRNHAAHVGFNVNRHSATGTATANKPAIIMGFEDNYYDDGGDAHYGVEWYVEYYSPDGTSIQQRRPFYARVQSSDNIADNCTVKVEVGTDGTGQLVVKTDSSHTLFQVTPSSSAAQVNYLKVVGGATGVGVSVGANGEANAPLLLSSNGTGRVDIETGFFSRIGFRVADTASSVNFVQVAPAATTVGPTISAQGEANVPLNLTSAGTGSVVIKTGGGTGLAITNTASALNSIQITPGGTGVGAIIGSTGEANAPLLITSSGSGRIDFLSDFVSNVQFRISRTLNSANFLQVTGAATGANAKMSASSENIVLGSGSALLTTATAGYVLFPSCAGTPTGVPTGQGAGAIPMQFDTTGVKLWFYTGGAWKGVVVA